MVQLTGTSLASGAPIPQKTKSFQGDSTSGRIDGYNPVWGQTGPKSAAWPEDFARVLEESTKDAESGPSAPDTALALQAEQSASQKKEDESFGFLDFLDIINPLQHIPIVSSVYRAITGDKIGPAAEVLGGALFGGPIGAAAGVASAVITHETGKEPGQALVDLFRPSPDIDGLDGTTIALADLTQARSAYNE